MLKQCMAPARSLSIIIAATIACDSPTEAAPLEMTLCRLGVVPDRIAVLEGERWVTRNVDASGTFHVPNVDKVGLAFRERWNVGRSNRSSWTIAYLTLAELRTLTCPHSGTESVNFSVSGLGNDVAIVALAMASQSVTPSSVLLTLHGVPSGNVDLVGALYPPGSSDQRRPRRFVMRRGVDTRVSTPIIDFDTEGIPPRVTRLTVEGLGNEVVRIHTRLRTGTTLFDPPFGSTYYPPVAAVDLDWLPDALRLATDRTEVSASAHTVSGRGRGVARVVGDPADMTLALGPELEVAVTDTVAATPYVRPRVRLKSQAAYPTGFFAWIVQSYGGSQFSPASFYTVCMVKTAAYLGSTPDTWDASVPDLSQLAAETVLLDDVPIRTAVSAFSGPLAMWTGEFGPAGGETRWASSGPSGFETETACGFPFGLR
jgi:hypothetical protein